MEKQEQALRRQAAAEAAVREKAEYEAKVQAALGAAVSRTQQVCHLTSYEALSKASGVCWHASACAYLSALRVWTWAYV